MRSGLWNSLLVSATFLLASSLAAHAGTEAASEMLASPDSFASISDEAERSAAIFTELGKVLTSLRCLNCHPAGNRPRQGDASRLHQPPVFRGADGYGLASMRCNVCHQSANFEPGRVPGHPAWHLAPHEMGWEGKTLGMICRQVRDPDQNGGRSLADLVEHIGSDTLVGWAWEPGHGRMPAPGTQKAAGALVEAWIETGATCPK